MTPTVSRNLSPVTNCRVVTPLVKGSPYYSPISNNSQQHAFSFAVTLLRRPAAQQAWGISFSKFNSLVILGSITTSSNLIQGYWTQPATSISRSKPSDWLHSPLFSQQAIPHIIRKQSQSSNHRQALLPGDVVLAINGHCISQYGMEALAQYLRSAHQLCLFIVRQPAATAVACHQHETLLRSGMFHLNRSSYFAAQAAHELLAPYFQVGRENAQKGPTPKGLFTKKTHKQSKQTSVTFLNPLFVDVITGHHLPYDDNDSNHDWDPDEGTYARQFFHPLVTTNFPGWLADRKRKWKSTYQVYPITQIFIKEEKAIVKKKEEVNRFDLSVPIDFWSSQGHESFHQWMNTSKIRWKRSYSWNQQKRRRIEEDIKEVVHLEASHFDEWLRVRKSQWLVQRRKRQRERFAEFSVAETPCQPTNAKNHPEHWLEALELVLIDEMLEEKERESQQKKEIPPFDVARLMDPVKGCPDDVLVHCLSYLPAMEHGKLLCISMKMRNDLEQRELMWQQLCPSHWTLPRRPRKPWYELYLGLLRRETENARKKWDDVLSKGSRLLLKGDYVMALEKLVTAAEKEFQFDVNYTSGVVCERNALLNLAVINQRHMVVRWLVRVKEADIETFDRGGFTPLLNASYAGDRLSVRFLLQCGADRSKIGRFHYTRPLCSPDFKGYKAEDWADRKGFPDLARLIRLGL